MSESTNPFAPQGGATFTGADGVQRRTIVAGAAWTIPVVATAIGAPLAAASGETPTLAFTNGPYTVAACGTLKDIVIKATTDGTTAAPAETPVTVTLPAGLTWSNGDTGTRILPTDANGEVVLSGLKATSAGGSRTIGAAISGTSASAPVAVTTTGSTFQWSATSNAVMAGNAPAGSTAVGWNSFVDPNGNLWVNGTQRASGLDPATTSAGDGNGGISWTDRETGETREWRLASNDVIASGAPAGSTAIWWNTYIDPNGNLWVNGTQRASGLDPAKTAAGDGGVSWTDRDTGQTLQWSINSNTVFPSNAPNGSTAVGWNTYVDPQGNLWVNGTERASGLDPATTATGDGEGGVSWTDVDTGQTLQWRLATNDVVPSGAPAGSTAIWWNTYIDPNGNLWVNGTQRASGLDPAKTAAGEGGVSWGALSVC